MAISAFVTESVSSALVAFLREWFKGNGDEARFTRIAGHEISISGSVGAMFGCIKKFDEQVLQAVFIHIPSINNLYRVEPIAGFHFDSAFFDLCRLDPPFAEVMSIWTSGGAK